MFEITLFYGTVHISLDNRPMVRVRTRESFVQAYGEAVLSTLGQSERSRININILLILKMQDIIFFAGKLFYGPFQGIF